MATYDLPTNSGYGTVTGRFLLAYADSNDADVYPDGAPAAGTIIFTPSAAYLKDITASPAPVTILPSSVSCTLDYDGYLLGPDGTRGVRLVATDDADLNPVGWTWSVVYRLTDVAGNAVNTITSHSLSLPQGTTVDLTSASPVPASNGTYYTVGPTGPTGPQGPAGSLSGLTATAPIVYNSGTSNLSFNGTVQSTNPSNKALIVKGLNLTATVTNAVGNGTTVTYTATNAFVAGQIVSITGLGILTGSSLNLTSVVIATASGTGFTVTNSTVGTSSGTGTATGIQGANLLELQDSAATLLSAIDSLGRFTGTLGTTNLNKTGSVAFWTPGASSQAAWAALPIGTGTMVANAQSANGAPNANYGYFFKTAHRDTGGGWSGIWIDYTTNDFYTGVAASNTVYATWTQFTTVTSAQTLTNKTLTSPVVTTPAITGGTITGGTVAGATLGTAQTFENAFLTASAFSTGGYQFYTTTNGAVQYITANSTGAGTLNITSASGVTLNSIMATNQSLTVVLALTQTTTGFLPSAYQIDGSAVTPKWALGIAPTASASAIDVITLTIIKTASATFTVLASATKFA